MNRATISRLLIGICLVLVLTQRLLYVQYLDSVYYVKGYWKDYLDLAGIKVKGLFLIDLILWILVIFLLILLVIVE